MSFEFHTFKVSKYFINGETLKTKVKRCTSEYFYVSEINDFNALWRYFAIQAR